MPTETVTRARGWVWCTNVFCKGNEQRETDLVRTQTDWTFFERGGPGSVPGIEQTSVRFALADEEDSHCRACGGPTDCSDQKRPVYPRTRQDWDPNKLLELIANGTTDGKAGEVDELKALVAEQSRALEEMQAALRDMRENPPTPPRRGPGRPPNPKPTED